MADMRETDLYPPVKAFLEGQGYEVKGDVAEADVVACRGDAPPVIVELKTSFSLALLHQAVARLSISDTVYVCVPRKPGMAFHRALKDNIALCRRLGLGVILVRLSDGHVEVPCDPGPYAPRKSAKRRDRLLREFARRDGDPSPGGSVRGGVVTAYRQDAMRVAAYLVAHGPSKGAVVAKATGVTRATRIMADDHYGWFERVQTGVYALTKKGAAASETAEIGKDAASSP
ncbi:DUF2161 domain-containing phosphodiesterase [Psychromarinibacter halotolerans]|uniref:DUF2161 domain-containing phosphodiesterase n=1 Tax=Psychromarinibacter halotolerans TaxID=1775175 RepID=A0ABV7GQM7_9RHOB|nr:DUF2161 family putative PD-(D/E)XK-type phosphodiesterase [Psychromarinibacter halotolerans]MDF0597854.1 DUF2161 family putative PD-(D/E)XK-type phosphodiesterase [Psychromarinibacter halotolerans]